MSAQLNKLVKTIYQAQQKTPPPEGEVISVDETIAKAASVYEVIRNTLEYDEVHRLRRNAIRRILRRRLEPDEDMNEVARELLNELIWARYLPNKQVHEDRIKDVAKVLKKYRQMFIELGQMSDTGDLYEWILDLMSTELEYLLIPPIEQEALATYAYNEFKDRIKWKSKLIKPSEREMQLYLVIHRTVLRSNLATLRYRVMLLFYPDWSKASENLIEEVVSNLKKVHQSVEAQINHPGLDSLSRLVRRYVIMFNVLHDVIANNPEKAPTVLSDKASLKQAVDKAAKKRYKDFHTRLRRGVIRAVIFLFITKMLLALLIEFPYDVVIIQTENFIPLITNVVFFPILLMIIGATVTIPQKKNTDKIITSMHSLLYNEGELPLIYRTKRPWRSTLGHIFDLLYLAMFVVSYGLIASLLYSLDFNTLSIVIFLFFLSLVVFFGVKLRMGKRDLLIVDKRSGILSTLVDFYFLPIIRVGRWMALRAPRINVFLFFLDYIVEAPFKMAIAMIEGWLAFIREKKEEIE